MVLNTSLETPGNITAVTGIVASILGILPTVLGIIAGLMGIAWYCVLFYDRFIAKGPAADHEKGA